MGSWYSSPPPPPPPRMLDGPLRLPPLPRGPLLGVNNMPWFEDETQIEPMKNGYFVVSLRGEDEALFRAYLAGFLETYTGHVEELRPDVGVFKLPKPSPLRPQWCILLRIRPAVYDRIFPGTLWFKK